MRPVLVALIAATSAGCPRSASVAGAAQDAGAPRPRLVAVGPRMISNETSQPLDIWGERLVPGSQVLLGPPVAQAFSLTVLDSTHAVVRLPPLRMPVPDQAETVVEVSLVNGEGQARLVVIDDADFPDPIAFALSRDAGAIASLSTTEDRLFLATRSLSDGGWGDAGVVALGDGPAALGAHHDASGGDVWVVVHRFLAETWLVPQTGDAAAIRKLPGYLMASGVVVDEAANVAFIAEQAHDTVVALSLEGSGRELWRAPVAPNPAAMTLLRGMLYVGSLQTGAVEVLDAKTGLPQHSISPGSRTAIVGGGTEGFSRFIMGGKAPRALVGSTKLNTLFVASIGPNIGPNPQKMEVSMNGGVGVVDVKQNEFVLHRGFGEGTPSALALDEARGVLYLADEALGVIRVVDAAALAAGGKRAQAAVLQTLELPVPDDVTLGRPRDDFAPPKRASVSMHVGPHAMALSPDAKTLYVLERFVGRVAVVDVTAARQGKAAVRTSFRLIPLGHQKRRRLGQVLYHADFGRTSVTCDACHLEGHTEGVFFEKTEPLRVYRSPTLRGVRDTPPYFTPASTHSMGETMKVVGGRNRFHNGDLTVTEIDALTLYGSCLTSIPNPFRGPDGAPPERLRLPDGREGRPAAGRALFERTAHCVECHPPPLFTTDQDLATRGKYLDVGTPHVLPIRPELQNEKFLGFAPPSLRGAFDIFPMLTTGAAGLAVENGDTLTVGTQFPLKRAVLDFAPTHGNAGALSETEQADLLAYLFTL